MIAKPSGPEFKVGLYVLTITGIALFLLVYIGIKKDLFAPKMTYYVISTTGENVERGTPVRLSGFNVGQVTEVDLTKVDYVLIEIDVLERFRKWFTRDSQIILVQGGFIGQTYLKLVPGKEGSPVLDEGATIQLTKVGGLDEIIAEARPVIDDLKIIVDNIQQLTDQMMDDDGHFQRTMANVETLSSRLASEDGLVAYLTSDPEPVARLESLLDKTDRTMTDISGLVDSADTRIQGLAPLQEDLQALVGEVRGFVAKLDDLARDIQPAMEDVAAITGEVKKATRDLQRLRTRSEYTIRLGSEVLQRIKQTWPLSRGDEQTPPLDHPAP